MTDTISRSMKKQVYALAWHSLSQQGQSPTDKDTCKDFHKLVSTMNFFIGLGRLSFVWFCPSSIWKSSRKSKLLIGMNQSPKAETLEHLQRTHIPTLVRYPACRKVFSANTSKPQSFHLFAYKDDFISKWSSNNQCSP